MQEENKEKAIWAIYVRVSSRKQAKDPEGSPKSQEFRCIEYLKRRFGDTIQYLIFFDTISGRTCKRRSYNDMLEMIESRKIEGVITTEVSRLNRETVACSILRNLCKKNNITLIALSENIDTSSAQDSSFFFHIWAARAQDESERISQRVHTNSD